MDKAADQALRAGDIIRRLRDFVARGESERRVEDVKKLIEEASALALVGAKDKGVRVSFTFAPGLDFVLADKVQVQQVLLNLMRNAIEAMEETDRRELAISTSPAPDNMVEISRRRYRRRHCARNQRSVIPALRHHETARHGRRPVDFTHHYRSAWRLDHAAPNPGGGTVFSLTLPAVTKDEAGDAI